MREPNAARRLEVPARTGSAPQGALDLAPSARSGATSPPARPVRDPRSLGTAGGSGSGPRTWDTSPQAIDTHPADKPRAHNCNNYGKKTKIFLLFGWFLAADRAAEAPGTAPERPPDGRCGARLVDGQRY